MLTAKWLKSPLQLICLFSISLQTRCPPSLPSLRFIYSSLRKQGVMTAFVLLWLTLQHSFYKISLCFTVEISLFSFFLLSCYLCLLTLNTCILSFSWLVSRVNFSVIQVSSVCSKDINLLYCTTMSLPLSPANSTKAAKWPLHFGFKAADWSHIITPNMLPMEA